MTLFTESAYDKKVFFRSLLGLAAVAALMKFTGGVGFVVFAVISLFALFTGKVSLMLYGLIVANCAMLGNSWFFTKGLVFYLVQRGMMVLFGICLAVKVFGGKNYRGISPLMWILPYVIYMIIPSAMGWAPLVSLLKIFLFVTIFSAYAGAAKMALGSRKDDERKLRAMILAAMAFFIYGSVILLFFPGIGYLGSEEMLSDPRFVEDIAAGVAVSLFKGMTWHSQALGPLMSIFCIFLLGDMLFNVRKADWLYITMIAICPLLVYKTSSRTAMAVLICGIMVLLFLFHGFRNVQKSWKQKVTMASTCIIVPMVIGVLAFSNVREGAVKFALKYAKDVDSRTQLTMHEVMLTRQGFMDQAMYNWRKKPIMGNGFQVSEQMLYDKREGLKDYLTAPIEKGVWVTAVLEEGGIVGFFLFCMFWISAVLALWGRGCRATAAMLLSIIIMNMAEFTIFSMTGGGGFVSAAQGENGAVTPR